MMDLRARPYLVFSFALALAACAPMKSVPDAQQPLPPPGSGALGRYEVLSEPKRVAELRAAPAPAHAEIADSQSPSGDERVLAAKGFVHIGNAYYAGIGEEPHAWLIARAADVGADRVMVYAVNKSGEPPSLYAAYYVRFKLPFGATFRDLHTDEREAAGGTGVKLDSVIGNSPADAANLLKGDVVIKFDGEPIRDRADFERRLREKMGKHVVLVVLRNGETKTRVVRLGVLATEANAAK